MFRMFRSTYIRRWLRYNAIRKGLLGRQAPWMIVFVGSIVLKRANTVLKRGTMPIRFSEKLEPGVSYLITHITPPTRKERRQARRSA